MANHLLWPTMQQPFNLQRTKHGKVFRGKIFPRIPTCGRSGISLTFDGKTLWASGSKLPILFQAVSGRPNTKGLFEYSTEKQKIPFQGPIPAGEYWVQPSQLWENNWFKSELNSSRSAWGNYRLTIHPYLGTQTYGRGGFFIHGGTAAGSAGCIDLALNIDRFVE